MNTRPITRFIAPVLIFALLLTGVPADALSQGAAGPYDGQTLFRGLLMGGGPVGQLFPEAWDTARGMGYDPDSPAVQEIQQRLVSEIAQKDPGFMARFASDVQSGDHLRIQQAVGDGGTRLLKQLEEDRLLNPGTPMDETFVWLVVMVAVAALVAALVAVVIVMVPVGIPVPTDKSQPGLPGEMYVDLIASRLAASPR